MKRRDRVGTIVPFGLDGRLVGMDLVRAAHPTPVTVLIGCHVDVMDSARAILHLTGCQHLN